MSITVDGNSDVTLESAVCNASTKITPQRYMPRSMQRDAMPSCIPADIRRQVDDLVRAEIFPMGMRKVFTVHRGFDYGDNVRAHGDLITYQVRGRQYNRIKRISDDKLLIRRVPNVTFFEGMPGAYLSENGTFLSENGDMQAIPYLGLLSKEKIANMPGRKFFEVLNTTVHCVVVNGSSIVKCSFVYSAPPPRYNKLYIVPDVLYKRRALECKIIGYDPLRGGEYDSHWPADRSIFLSLRHNKYGHNDSLIRDIILGQSTGNFAFRILPYAQNKVMIINLDTGQTFLENGCRVETKLDLNDAIYVGEGPYGSYICIDKCVYIWTY